MPQRFDLDLSKLPKPRKINIFTEAKKKRKEKIMPYRRSV